MNVFKLASLITIAAIGSTATAQTTGKTRTEVKAETRAAIKSGDIAGPGDSGKTLRETSPQKYLADKAGKKTKRVKRSPAVDPAAPSR